MLMRNNAIIRNPLFWITLTVPFVLFATVPLLPTYDDWGATPGPNPDPFSWTLLLPRHSYWRIPENLYGYAIAHYRWLMPWFPHVIVIAGHYVGCCVVFLVCRELRFSVFARNIATLFFWITTGAIATTTACDGMSQTWVQALGMMALYSYLKRSQNGHSYRWLILIVLATFVKENALCWGVAIPLIGYVFGVADKRTSIKSLAYGISFALLYTVVHFIVPTAENYVLNESYFDFSVLRFLRGLALLMTFTWLPLDYTHLLHAPHRNILCVAFSAIASLPFILLLFGRQVARFRDVKAMGLILAFFVIVSPHLLTIFSLMHGYASLGVAALIVGYFVECSKVGRRHLSIAFAAFALTSVIVNAEHCWAAYESGFMGKRLSLEAVNGVRKPVEKAFLLSVYRGETRYSNFYVLPLETFDYGNGILWENEYKWPKTIDCDEVEAETFNMQEKVDSLLRLGYDCVWVLDKDHIVTYQ